MKTFARTVWLNALGGGMRFAEPLAPAREVWVARPQRLVRDGIGRIIGASATGDTCSTQPVLLIEWLYRPGAEKPDYCHAVPHGATLPTLFPAAWVRSPRNLVLLRPALSAPHRRTA